MITFTTKRLSQRLTAYLFSHKNSLINTPPQELEKDRLILKENIWRTPDLTYKVSPFPSRNHRRPISAMANTSSTKYQWSTATIKLCAASYLFRKSGWN